MRCIPPRPISQSSTRREGHKKNVDKEEKKQSGEVEMGEREWGSG